jgi:hypothetical protein
MERDSLHGRDGQMGKWVDGMDSMDWWMVDGWTDGSGLVQADTGL